MLCGEPFKDDDYRGICSLPSGHDGVHAFVVSRTHESNIREAKRISEALDDIDKFKEALSNPRKAVPNELPPITQREAIEIGKFIGETIPEFGA